MGQTERNDRYVYSIKPHIYMLRGQWTCAERSGGWQVWPYGKGDTPDGAYQDYRTRVMECLLNPLPSEVTKTRLDVCCELPSDRLLLDGRALEARELGIGEKEIIPQRPISWFRLLWKL